MKNIDQCFSDWEGHVFGFGYGTGEPYILPVLKQFLSECPIDGAYDHVKLEATLSPPVAWLLINMLAGANVLEYGTSPRFGWLTPQGIRLKEYVGSKTVDELVDLVCRDEDYTPCYPTACNCGPDGYEEGRKCENPFWR
jgi:hypothetical protein